MNSTALSTKGVKVAVSALLAAAAFMAFGLVMNAGNAKAAAGDPINAEFNYVGLNVGTTVAGEVDSIVLEPPTTPIGIAGTYTDKAGNFTVPQDTGLVFPPVVVDLDVVQINGEISLTKDGTGNYNSSTGAMSMDLSLALTLGVDDLEALGTELGIPLGTGALACKFAPLDVALGTAKGWPHAGSAFADKANLEDGALAGAWRATPAAVATEGDQSVCNIIGGFLQPVGGIWLANSTTPVATMPAATEPKPEPITCEELGKEGSYPDCTDPVCPEGQIGTYPDCENPPPPLTDGKVGTLTITKKVTVKAGKKATVKISIKNTGQKTLATKVALTSSNKQVKAPKTVAFSVGAGKTVTKSVSISTTKKAKGKATITAKAGGKTAKSSVTVKAAKKKKK